MSSKKLYHELSMSDEIPMTDYQQQLSMKFSQIEYG